MLDPPIVIREGQTGFEAQGARWACSGPGPFLVGAPVEAMSIRVQVPQYRGACAAHGFSVNVAKYYENVVKRKRFDHLGFAVASVAVPRSHAPGQALGLGLARPRAHAGGCDGVENLAWVVVLAEQPSAAEWRR